MAKTAAPETPDVSPQQLIETDETLKKLNSPDYLKNWALNLDLEKEVAAYIPQSDAIQKKYDMTIPESLESTEDLHALARSFKLVQSFQDRVLEIKLKVLYTKRDIDKAHESGMAYVNSKYLTWLGRYGTKDVREAVAKNLIQPLVNAHRDHEHLLETCDLVSANLTRTHFCLAEIQRIASLINDGKKALQRTSY